MFFNFFHIKKKKIETSLIEEFYYPKYGPGHLWETVANKITEMGGTILKNSEVNDKVKDSWATDLFKLSENYTVFMKIHKD